MKQVNDDDVQIEEDAGEEGAARDAEAKVKKLKDELERVKAEKQEYLDGWQRAKADYVNLLRRLEDSAKGAETAGLLKAVEKLLPAYDALERAKEHLPAGRQAENMNQGFEAIAKQLEAGFKAVGLEPIGMIGERFDPTIHEALGQDAVESADQEGEVTAVLEKGWRLGEQILRPAKVRVGQVG